MVTENTMTTDNIFSGLKVVDFANFIAGPGAAVILSDFGADVIKVEPPKGDIWRMANKVPPQPLAKDAYQWHLNNRNKRGLALDLKSPDAGKILERLVKWADVLIVNTPHQARKKLKLEYDDVAQWNSHLIYADLTGYGEKGPDAALPGFDITAYWSRSGLLSLTHDAGNPTHITVRGHRRQPNGRRAVWRDRYGLVSTRTYRQGLLRYHIAIRRRRLVSQRCDSGLHFAEAKFSPQHDRKNPANARSEYYTRVLMASGSCLSSRRTRYRPSLRVSATPNLLKDPRFADLAKLASNMGQLTTIVDEIFSAQPMKLTGAEVFDKTHITYGLVQDPSGVIKDPQLSENDIVVPLAGAGGNLKIRSAVLFKCTASLKYLQNEPRNWRTQRRDSKGIRVRREGNRQISHERHARKTTGT